MAYLETGKNFVKLIKKLDKSLEDAFIRKIIVRRRETEYSDICTDIIFTDKRYLTIVSFRADLIKGVRGDSEFYIDLNDYDISVKEDRVRIKLKEIGSDFTYPDYKSLLKFQEFRGIERKLVLDTDFFMFFIDVVKLFKTGRLRGTEITVSGTQNDFLILMYDDSDVEVMTIIAGKRDDHVNIDRNGVVKAYYGKDLD